MILEHKKVKVVAIKVKVSVIRYSMDSHMNKYDINKYY